jgi:carboxyl-terminal processing protease
MQPRRIRAVTLVLLLLLPAYLRADTNRSDELRRLGQASEQRGEWIEACRAYDEAYRRDHAYTDCRDGYQRCLRQFHLQRRQRDPGYREVLARLTTSQALDIYEEVLKLVSAAYVDRDKADLNILFQQGLGELRFALDDESFRRSHLAGVSADRIRSFKIRLDEWSDHKVINRLEARQEVFSLVGTAQDMGLGERAHLLPVFALEFASGACNALDEYTLFLTPGHYADVQGVLAGKSVGVGIEVNTKGEPGYIERVYPRSPAEEAGVLPGDRILQIGKSAIGQISPGAIAHLLRGDAGTEIELIVQTQGHEPRRTGPMVRRAVVAPSVEYRPDSTDMMDNLAYLRIYSFQESTLVEMQEAIAQLNANGAKGVILDLRGNPGGLFKSSVQISELFVGSGVIVRAESQMKYVDRALARFLGPTTSRKGWTQTTYKADSMNPLTLPLVVLVDGETASSAEVLAGALKDRALTRLLGQTTYGKGSIQSVIPLSKSQGGIRITVARLFSPAQQPYTGNGVVPHDFYPADGDAILRQARTYLQGLLRMPVR